MGQERMRLETKVCFDERAVSVDPRLVLPDALDDNREMRTAMMHCGQFSLTSWQFGAVLLEQF